MKRFTSFALVLLVALAVTGFAVAKVKESKSTNAVVATFTATATADKKTRQCTGADGTYNVTRGVYEGTAAGDPLLAGKVTVRIESVVNATSGLGWTKGHVAFRDADDKLKAKAGLVAVTTGSAALNGFLTGRVKEGGQLLANFSAAFSADGSSITGELGSGAAVNTAILTKGACARAEESGHDEKKLDGDEKKKAEHDKKKADREKKKTDEKKTDEKKTDEKKTDEKKTDEKKTDG